MKHRLTYLFAILVILGSLGMSLFQMPVAQASRVGTGSPPEQPGGNTASEFCGSEHLTQEDPAYKTCVSDFNAGKSGKSVVDTCPSNLEGFPSHGVGDSGPGSGSDFFQCEGYWAGGAKAKGANVQLPGTKIDTFCNANFTSTYLDSCNQGAKNSNKSSAGKACDKSDPAYDACSAGWAQASGKNDNCHLATGCGNGNTPATQAAISACQDKHGAAYTGCVAGYDGATNGQTKDQACQDFAGASLKACEDAWGISNNAQQQKNGDNSPTCENQGGPLAWILCPIFNMFSDASQFIFQNIVQPFLVAQPVSTDPNDPSFQIWSNLRVYGDIFLIIALLVVVFGESIGGGLIDAYTAKKILPRLLVAAILINLSIYLVAFLVDFSNILGKGVGYILTAPLTHCQAGGGNCWDFNLSLGDQARVFSVGLIGLLAGGTAVAGFLGTIIFGGFAGISAIITVAFFVLLPVFFSILAVFITLIVRQGLILMLVLVSPVAFALYCLPNTERIFRRWWDLLLETLMVYPIIVAIFGVAEILSVTILSANGISPADLQNSGASGFFANNLSRTLALVIAFLLQFLPLLAVPFAFRFASGTLGRVYDLANNAGQQINKLAETRREHAKRDYQAQSQTSRARIYHGMNDFGQRHQGPLGIGRRVSRRIGRTAGGYNIEALTSAGRAEKAKELNDQIATGRDEEIRGLTVNKQWALTHGEEGVDFRTGAEGIREFKTLGGAWVAEQDVDAGHGRWGSDQYAQQAALSYEMRKGITEEDAGRIATNYQHVAAGPGGWGMSQGEAGGAFKGAAFENQNQHVDFKYTDLFGNNAGQLSNARDFVDEIYNNRGSYNLAQMNSHTIEQLKNAYQATDDADQKQKIAAIAETFMHDTRVGGGQVGQAGPEGREQPLIDPGTGQPTGGRVASTPGSAHTAERVRELAEMTGAYGTKPTGLYTDPGHAPTPNDREQS